MPEGDTVWRTAQRLNQALAGQPLTISDLRWPNLSTLDFRGRITVEVVSRGKHILHRLDDGHTIHSHLRMEGQWRLDAPAQSRPNGHTRAVLGTEAWTALGQRLGMLDVVRTIDEHTLVGHLGPDLLGLDWDATLAASNLSKALDTIGAALLDQTNLAGLGTLYTAEVLFLQRIDPWRHPATLTESELAGLVNRGHTLLDHNKNRATQSTTGYTQRGATTWVYGRAGQPCRRCGTPITSAPIGPPIRRRALFHCPTCQISRVVG